MAQPDAAPLLRLNSPQSTRGSDTSSGPIGWPDRVTLLVLLATSAALRLWRLTGKPFWFDECFSVEVARLDWRNFLHLLWWREANMSLYYLLLRLWLQFGQSEFFIRSFSVAAAVATLPAIHWIARMLYGRRVALIAAALFAFNAYSVRYAQEARSYSLFLLLATLSSGFLIAWLLRPDRRNWIAYVLVSTLAVYAHFYAMLLVVVHIVAVRWFGLPVGTPDDTTARLHLRRAWLTIGVAVSPLLIFVAKTGAGPIRWIQRPGLKDLLEFSEHLAGGNVWLLLVICAACLAGVATKGKSLISRHAGWEIWRCQFLLLWLLLPVATTVVLSFGRPVFLPRYLIFCLPALEILAAVGLAKLRKPYLLAPVLAGVLLLSWQGVAFVYGHDFDNNRDASGAATNFILEHSQPEDAIMFHIAETRVPYEFFRSLRAGQNTASPDYSGQFGPAIVFPHHGAGLDYRDFTGKPTAEFVQNIAPAHRRMWVMLMYNGTADNPDPTTRMLTQILPQSFPNVQRWQFEKVEVRLYSR
jgi:mannosyltransferase